MASQQIHKGIGLLGLFIAMFAMGAFVSSRDESPLFIAGLSAVFGGLVGVFLLIGIGRQAWATRRAMLLAAAVGALAYPGHYLARAAVETVCSGLSVQMLPGTPSSAELGIELAILGGYWFGLPFALGRYTSGAGKNAP